MGIFKGIGTNHKLVFKVIIVIQLIRITFE